MTVFENEDKKQTNDASTPSDVEPKVVTAESNPINQQPGEMALLKKVLWIDDVSNNDFIDNAERAGIYIEQRTTVDSGINELLSPSASYDAIILDANCISHDDGRIEPDISALGYALRKITENNIYLPWFVYSGGGFDGEGSIDITVRSYERPYDDRHWYKKPLERKQMFDKINEVVADLGLYKLKNKYPDIFSWYPNPKELVEILEIMENGDTRNANVFNNIRKQLEWIMKRLNKCGFLPDDMFNVSNLGECSKFLGNSKLTGLVPFHIQRCLHSATSICNNGSHREYIDKMVDKMVMEGNAPYLIRSTIYEFLNILYWLKDLRDGEESVENTRAEVSRKLNRQDDGTSDTDNYDFSEYENKTYIIEQDEFGNFHCGKCYVPYSAANAHLGETVELYNVKLNTKDIVKDMYPLFAYFRVIDQEEKQQGQQETARKASHPDDGTLVEEPINAVASAGDVKTEQPGFENEDKKQTNDASTSSDVEPIVVAAEPTPINQQPGEMAQPATRYNLDTTIEYLRQHNLISTRTKNCLDYAQLLTIGDVVDFIGNNVECLLDLPKFGQKSLSEIEPILDSVMQNAPVENMQNDGNAVLTTGNDDIDHCIESAFNAVLESSGRFGRYIEDRFPSGLDLHFSILRTPKDLLTVEPDLNKKDNIALRHCFLDFISKTISLIEEGGLTAESICELYQMRYNEIDQEIESFTDSDFVQYFMDREMRELIERRYQEMCEEHLTNRRTKNVQEKYLASFEGLVPYFDEPQECYSNIRPGTNPYGRTLTDIYHFNQLFKEEYRSIAVLSPEEILEMKIKKNYPFLSDDQRRSVKKFINEHGQAPLFFLLYLYVRNSTERPDEIFCYSHGINDGGDGRRQSNEEIGQHYGITGERVRQIKAEQPLTINQLADFDKLIGNYENLSNLNYISKDSVEYQIIANVENLPYSFELFAKFLSKVLDFKVIPIHGRFISVNSNSDLDGIDFAAIENQFDGYLGKRYAENTLIPVDSLLSGYTEAQKDAALDVVRYIIQGIYGQPIKDGCIIFSQNHIDIPGELFDILQNNQRLMSKEELCKELRQKYPDLDITPESIRPTSHEHIIARGNQGLYGLDTWDVNYGTIRDILFEVIDASDVPVQIEELLEKVQEHYPDTNLRSISSSMQSEGRFVFFQDNFVGVTGRDYPQEFQERANQRFSFEERYDSFERFVEKFHRFPLENRGDEEASLARWYNNIKKDRLEAPTQDQKQQLDDLVQWYTILGYPQTGYEYDFYKNCVKYKEFIMANRAIPTRNNNGGDLYDWLKRSQEHSDGFNDQRRKYLKDLLDFIQSLGF